MVLLRVVLSAAVMGLSVFLLSRVPVFVALDSKGGLLALIGAGAMVYVVALLASGSIERREIRFLRNLALERLARGRVS
jgi:hypothetical protein